MFTKLDWYIMKKFMSSFLLALGLFTILILVIDISEKIDEFIAHDVPFKEIAFDYYLNLIPFFLNLFAPIFVFISVIFFTSKMAARTEFVAMLAAGISYVRILRPYILSAFIIALGSLSMNMWVIPQAKKTQIAFEIKHIRDKGKSHGRNIVNQIRPGIMMTMRSFNLNDSSGFGIVLETVENNELKSKLMAEQIRWNKAEETWRLTNYKWRIFNDNSGQTLQKGKYLDTMIPFNPVDYFRRDEDVQSFNIPELNEYIKMEDMRGSKDLFFYKTEKQRRFADPFTMVLLTVIGVIVSSVKSRHGIGLHLAKGILISFAYLFIVQTFLSYGKSGTLHPVLAAWLPSFAFIFVALWLYRGAQK
jgi:lipopolysaccharide export system permease protein